MNIEMTDDQKRLLADYRRSCEDVEANQEAWESAVHSIADAKDEAECQEIRRKAKALQNKGVSLRGKLLACGTAAIDGGVTPVFTSQTGDQVVVLPPGDYLGD